MAGRIVLALAFLGVVAAGAIGLMLLMEEGSDDPAGIAGGPALPVPECDPVTEEVAQQARKAFEKRHVPRADRPTWFSGVGATTVARARTAAARVTAVGRPASKVPADFDDDRSVLLVMFDPRQERPELPGCVRRTPVVYVGNGPFRPGEGGRL